MASSRYRTALALTLARGLLAFLPLDVLARGSPRPSGYTPRVSSSGTSHRGALSTGRRSNKCEICPRNRRSKIKRDPKAVDEFKRTHPKLPGCHRCEVDHIVPRSKGGRDDSSRIQRLSREQHKDKTKRDLRRP